MSETFHLLLSANKSFMEQSVVCMSSILRNNQGRNLHFHILHSEIENEILEQVKIWIQRESNLAEISFYFIHPDSYFFPVKPGDTISCETYFRILAAEQLPCELNKILYVDGDTICLGDLTELWETELDGYAAASREAPVPAYRKRNLGMKEQDFYFQAGVMLINLVWWRENDIAKKILNFIKLHPDILPRWDQDALNAILSGRVKKFHSKWNVWLDTLLPEQWEKENPIIVHYTGSQLFKPWFKNSISEFQSLYLEYRKDTPYYDREMKINKSSRLSFPFQLVPSNSRIVLYGAGQFGKAYYLQNMRCGFCKIVSWVDYNFGKVIYGEQVLPPAVLLDIDYDWILIAVSAKSMADNIKEELGGMGIPSDKILWNCPVLPMKVNKLETYEQWKQYILKIDRMVVCGLDKVTMACLMTFERHSLQKKVTKILIPVHLNELKEIMGIEMQALDEFQNSAQSVLLAVNDRFHAGWLTELYDRGCKEVYLLTNDCYLQIKCLAYPCYEELIQVNRQNIKQKEI